jgi:coproporphyrinogen III oxidase-like Fe-S oxidoreductase
MIGILEDFFRTGFRRLLTKEKDIVLEDKPLSLEALAVKFQDIKELGLYLHIPFCEQI